MPMPDSESVFVIPGSVLLWRIAPRPPNSAQVRPPVYLDLMALFSRPGWNQEEGRGEKRVIELLLSHLSVVPAQDLALLPPRPPGVWPRCLGVGLCGASSIHTGVGL